MSGAASSAVIIGYGPGVGDAVARAFAGEGYDLALIARDAGRVTRAAEGFVAQGCRAQGFAADAGDEVSLLAALAAAKAALGTPAVLVYNAAVWRPGPVLSVTPDDLAADLRTCAGGALAAVRSVVPAMRASGRGTLLFTGGGFALYPSPNAPTLSMGKASLRALALMLAAELASAGIRVGTVTIMGTVEPGTSLDPARIARAFLDLHRGGPDPATAEVQVR